MGSNDSNDEKPIHEVSVPTFELGKYEVTNAQFSLFLNDYASEKVKSGANSGQIIIYENDWGVKKDPQGKWQAAAGYENSPVVFVTWYGAVAYCEWLSQKTGQSYYLPSEAAWEYAARGGNQSKGYKYSGSNTIKDVAWYNPNSGLKTHPVGQKTANELGLFDMSGNVREWCADTWHEDYKSAPTDGSAWISGGEDTLAVLRGGSCYNNDSLCRSAVRNRNIRDLRLINNGFRLAKGGSAGGK